MYYLSTRDKNTKVSAQRAIVTGLSRDGGLFVPESIPRLAPGELDKIAGMDYVNRAAFILKKFLDDFSDEELLSYCSAAYGGGKFDDPATAPLKKADGTYFLELWHGPTSAFKDMALQMLPYLLTASLKKTGEEKICCILTATSGDTGKAALEGFKDVDRTRIVVFYPKNGVSQVQELQMTTQQGENVAVFSVYGNFDDAQAGVKAIFSDASIRERIAEKGFFFSSANSINLGRILPQIVYYISAYCDLAASGAVKMGESANVCVPTGNFGNILSAYYAKLMGLPVKTLVCASNSNNVLTDFLSTGVYDRNREFFCTTSPSMDILISSNLERLLFDLGGRDDALVKSLMEQLAKTGRYEVTPEMKLKMDGLFAAGFASDAEAAATIKSVWESERYLIDPHTAVALSVLRSYREKTGDATPTLLASTASPFKFCDSVLRALGETPEKSGVELIGHLAELSGLKAPKALSELGAAKVRFDKTVEKSAMPAAVLDYLG